MEWKIKPKKKILPSDYICRVCGNVARGMNFNVMSCIGCKCFFRRNALRSADTLRCLHKHNCPITAETRKKCASCRLKKCFAVGMKPELFRFSDQHQTGFVHIQQIRLPRPRPLNLLQNDCSRLSSEQWNLLSNIINVYDEPNIVKHVKCLLVEGSSLPIKLRAKSSLALDYINKCRSVIQTIIKRSPHFHSLTIDSFRTLIQHNIYLTSCLNTFFVGVEVDLWNNMDFAMSHNQLFGSDYFTKFAGVPKRMDRNGTLVKIMIFIIAFSSNYSIVTFDERQNIKYMSNSIDLIHIQDIFITLLWKYLIYLYGYTEAISRYCSLVKTVLDILHELEDLSNMEIYQQLLTMIIAQTEQLLIKDN